jgi:uncharacterized protein YdhG (YjbR/CyaY superfamily)
MQKSLPASVSNHFYQLDEKRKLELLALRDAILNFLPEAEEVLKYGMPTFVLWGKPICGILANKNHLSLYPYSGQVLRKLPEITSKYETTEGSWHIPYGKAISKKHLGQVINERLSSEEIQIAKSQANDLWLQLKLGAPARRALHQIGYKSLKDLGKITRKELTELHGMGPTSVSKIETAMSAAKLKFKN